MVLRSGETKGLNEKLAADRDVMLHTSLGVGERVNGATACPGGENWQLDHQLGL